MAKPAFRFKQFTVQQDRTALKVGTDGVLFGAWVAYGDARRMLDVGTGTGLLALIAAQRSPLIRVDALEIDPEAAAQAAENVADSPWSERITVHAADARNWPVERAYDLVVCNPPYYAGYSDPADPRVAVAKHGDQLLFTDLVELAVQALLPGGRLALIIPLHREREFLAIAAARGLHPQRRCAVRYVAHRPAKRVLLELGTAQGPLREEELQVENTGPFDYTQQYRSLIQDLMLNF